MASAVTTELSDILERLKQCGLRMTRNRQKLVEVLMESGRPLSADEIREAAGFASTDLVTVYRNLEAFQSAGLLQRIPLENGSQLFELTDLNDHYHHLICRECHKTERLEVCLGEQLSKKAKTLGYSQIAHVLEVYGLCRECSCAAN